jgi:hypothetical protein
MKSIRLPRPPASSRARPQSDIAA